MPGWMTAGLNNLGVIEKTIAAGKEFSAAIDSHGFLYTTGRNDYGRTGLELNTNSWTRVTNALRFTSVYCGLNFTIALERSGQLYAMGDNSSGQLGLGSVVKAATLTKVKGFENIIRVFTGPECTFILSQDGKLYATGRNDYGQLGLGHEDLVKTFSMVNYRGTLRKIALGPEHTLLLTDRAYSVGRNGYGELCKGLRPNSLEWLELGNYHDIAAGNSSSFLVSKTYDLYVCGYNNCGQLGIGNRNNRINLTRIPNLKVFGVQSSWNSFTFAFNTKNQLLVCGKGTSDQLSIPSVMEFTPVTSGVKVVATGHNHCIYKFNNSLKVVGAGLRGQLGLGDNNPRKTLTSFFL